MAPCAVGDDEDRVRGCGLVEGRGGRVAQRGELVNDLGREGSCLGRAQGVVFVEDEGADCG